NLENEESSGEAKENCSKEIKPSVKKSDNVCSGKIVAAEDQKEGGGALSLDWSYCKAMANYPKDKIPGVLSLLVLTSVASVLIPIFQNNWLSKWTQNLGHNLSEESNYFYLGIYALLGVITLLVCAFQHFYWSRKA